MNESPDTLVIINPAAARSARAWPRLRAALHEQGLRFSVYETRHANDATARTRLALRQGYRTIAAVGGDGTLSETAAGFFEFRRDDEKASDGLPEPINAEAALALLPAGTGDDFARGLAGRREPLGEWVKRLVANARDGRSTRTVDVIVGRTGDRREPFICLNVATIGLGADVAARVAGQSRLIQRLPGETRFVAAAGAALLAWRERRVRIKADEAEAIECTSNLIAVANNIYAGGGMMFAPDALTDDGLLDVVVTCGLSRRTIVRELPRIRQGRHILNPRVRVIRTRSVRIEPVTADDALMVEADGQLRGHTPAQFQVLPSALRVVF